MRLKLLKLATILLLAGSSHGRPQQSELSATFEPDLEIRDEEGWLPVANGRNFPQEQTPVDQDLPQIVEGNSRYKEDRRATHKKSHDFFRGEIIGARTNSKSLESGDANELQDEDKKDFARGRNSREFANVNSSPSSDFARILAKLKTLANVTSVASSSESAIRSGNFVEIIPQSTINPLSALNDYRSDLETEKSGELIMMRVEYNDASNSGSYSTIALQNKIRDSVPKPDLYPFESKTNAVGNASKESVVVFTNRDNGSLGKKSTKSTVKIKPEIYVPLNDVTSENKMDSDIFVKINSLVKNGANQKIASKPNSEHGYFYSNLKTWPYGGPQSTEDFDNHEKYTSFHSNDGNLDGYQFAPDSVYYQNVPMISNIGQKPNDRKKQKPPILVFENSLPPKYPTANNDPNVITIYDPEPFVEPNNDDDRETGNWQQIPAFTANQSYSPAANKNPTQLHDFASILENLQPNHPSTMEHDDVVTNQQDPQDEVLHNEGDHTNQVLAQDNHYENEPIFENSYSEVSVVAAGESNSDGEIGNDGTQLVQDEEFHGPKKPHYNSTSVVSQNTVVHIINEGDGKPNITVAEMKIPDIRNNSTDTTSLSQGPNHRANSSAYTPNVHVMFMTQQDGLEDNGLQQAIPQQKVPEVTYSQGTDCPTITINSYTTINNTLESKEGCTDLNIIINSHVVNTNLFQPATGNLGAENVIENDRKPGNSESPEGYGVNEVYGTSNPGYGGSNEGYEDYEVHSDVYGSPGGAYGSSVYPLENEQSLDGIPEQSGTQDFSIPNANGQNVLQEDNGFDQSYPSSSLIQVLQETEINLISHNDSPDPGEQLNSLPLQDELATDFQNDPSIPANGDANDPAVSGGDIDSNSAADVANDAPVFDDGVQSDLSGPADGIESDTPVVFQDIENDPMSSGVLGGPGIQSDPVDQEGTPAGGFPSVPGSPGVGSAMTPENDPGVLADPGIQSDPPTQGDPPAGGIPALPSLGGIGDSMADAGLADTPLSVASGGGTSGLQLPSFSNPLSGISGQLPGLLGASGAQGASGGSPSTVGAPSSVLDDEDDDDEDDFGLMPAGLVDTMTSYFPYLTFLSPLNLGFFSFAITPFAVAAAGILGFAALVSPWALPILDFGRAADRVTIKLKSNIEEDVKQSIHKYENWNDWKSRRKKRKI